jgi:hypothetical protein
VRKYKGQLDDRAARHFLHDLATEAGGISEHLENIAVSIRYFIDTSKPLRHLCGFLSHRYFACAMLGVPAVVKSQVLVKDNLVSVNLRINLITGKITTFVVHNACYLLLCWRVDSNH